MWLQMFEMGSFLGDCQSVDSNPSERFWSLFRHFFIPALILTFAHYGTSLLQQKRARKYFTNTPVQRDFPILTFHYSDDSLFGYCHF